MQDRILDRRQAYTGWFDVSRLTLQLASGERIDREIVEHPSGAAVLAYDPKRRVALLVSETRPPLLHCGEPDLIEAIAGALDDDLPDVCARREALEEGGCGLACSSRSRPGCG